MDLIIGFFVFLACLIASLALKINLVFPLVIGLLSFSGISLHRGFSVSDTSKMAIKGAKTSILVIQTFAFIGALTAVWRASGTIPLLVYCGITTIHPNAFLLSAFWLSCVVSYMIGTSFGTVGTVGTMLMVLGVTGDANVPMTAGAIISGAYFGDRCSPISSCLNLVTAVTKTDIYNNSKTMLKNAWPPFLGTSLIFGVLSLVNPLKTIDTSVLEEISSSFNLSILAILPALIILVLPILKVKVKLAMAASIICAGIIAILFQGMSVPTLLWSILTGFHTENAEGFLLSVSGGGIASMLNVMVIIFLSSSFSGIFEGTKMLDPTQAKFKELSLKIGVLPTTVITAILGSAIACNQMLSIIMTRQLLDGIYKENDISDDKFALDIANSAIAAGMIPWSIACSVPLATLSADASAIPFFFFLYLTPIFAIIADKKKTRKK